MKVYTPISVCYEDTDAGGVVYHSKYLGFAERARMNFLHEHGIYCKEMAQSEKPCGFMLNHCEINYKKPAYLEDELIVETELLELRGAGFDCLQIVKRGEEVLVEIKVCVCCVTSEGRPTRIPANIRSKLAEIS